MKPGHKQILYGVALIAVVYLFVIAISGTENVASWTDITGYPVVLWDTGGPESRGKYSPPKITGCSDSDSGLSLYVKGTCSYKTGPKGEGTSQKTDYCKSGYVLMEFYCSNDRYCLAKEYTCSDACIDGACMAPSKVKRTR